MYEDQLGIHYWHTISQTVSRLLASQKSGCEKGTPVQECESVTSQEQLFHKFGELLQIFSNIQ